jgi:sigma-B regulation protein RsbU (phosphoserine phosphatase)
VFSNWASEERTVELAAGDTLILFSDGVTEAGIETETEFGEDGLLSVIRAAKGANAESLVNMIITAVAGEKEDDVTVVAIRSM